MFILSQKCVAAHTILPPADIAKLINKGAIRIQATDRSPRIFSRICSIDVVGPKVFFFFFFFPQGLKSLAASMLINMVAVYQSNSQIYKYAPLELQLGLVLEHPKSFEIMT